MTMAGPIETSSAPVADGVADEQESPWPSAARGWTMVVLLALASMASQFDRTVVNLMVDPIKDRFALDDTHFSMLQSFAFGIFYMLACIPIGRMADRYQRRVIIGISLFFFSLFSMASGLARSYTQLFLTRVGVGVGEASITPAGLSMLSDLFPPQRLGQAVSVFFMSAPLGQGIALILGGGLLHLLTQSPLLSSGLFSGLEPWQAAFIIIGAPGLLLVPLFLMQREPARRGRLHAQQQLPIRDVLTVIRTRSSTLIPMFSAYALVMLASYASFVWTPSFFQRVHGWNAGEVGLRFGLVAMIFGAIGVWFAGWLSDKLMQRGMTDAPLKVAAFGFIGGGISGVLFPLMPTGELSLLMLVPKVLFSTMPVPCVGAAIQTIVPNQARAQTTSIYITVSTLVGLGGGPLFVGLMTDHLFQNPADIGYSLAIAIGVPAPLVVILLLMACKPYRALRAAQS